MEYQWLIDRVDHLIVNRSKTVVVVFLLATVVFVGGLGAITTESGQQQFIEDLSSFQAIEDINEQFGDSFPEETTSTTVVQESTNVLARPALVDMLETRNRILDRASLRVEEIPTTAETVATTIDPNATTADQQLRTIERATASEIDRAVQEAAETEPGFTTDLSDDFNREAASASSTKTTFSHIAGPGAGSADGPGGAADFPPGRIDTMERLAADDNSAIWFQGSPPDTIGLTTSLVLPSAMLLIMLFLIVAYRDLVDVLIGLFAIVMMLLWTFGFIGLVGIPFAALLVAVPPILIAIGIDFGIHSINRYREERAKGLDISESMTLTTDQVVVAFFIVVGTSTIGFLSNLVSAFPPTQDFGIVAAAGVVFTFLIFGIFVPALKVTVDRAREKYPIPTFSESPLGSESSPLGRLLSVGVTVSKRGPLVFLLLVLVLTAGSGVYATGVGTGFSPEDFNPNAETPDYLQSLPESIRPPEEFDYVRINDYIEANYAEEARIQMYVEGDIRRDSALEEIHRAGLSPPPSFHSDQREPEAQSLITVIESRAERDPEFRALVDRNDRNDNGIPDQNLPQIYDALESGSGGSVGTFLDDDRRGTQVIYTVDGEEDDGIVTDDAYAVSENFRAYAQPTGGVVIFDEAVDLIFESVVESLILTLAGAALFLVAAYWVIEGSPSLGVVNVIPILVTVVALVATMRLVGLDFNALNGSILAIAVGIGIDYSVHVVHRFADEYAERDVYTALKRTVVGTGGALTGSMLTTVFGIGVLVLALNPALGAFGALISLSVLYAYLASLFIMPSVIVVWARLRGDTDVELPVLGAVEGALRGRQSVPAPGDD